MGGGTQEVGDVEQKSDHRCGGGSGRGRGGVLGIERRPGESSPAQPASRDDAEIVVNVRSPVWRGAESCESAYCLPCWDGGGPCSVQLYCSQRRLPAGIQLHKSLWGRVQILKDLTWGASLQSAWKGSGLASRRRFPSVTDSKKRRQRCRSAAGPRGAPKPCGAGGARRITSPFPRPLREVPLGKRSLSRSPATGAGHDGRGLGPASRLRRTTM